jgi:hypothetical protein
VNKIVRTHYPIEKLPEDLRLGLSENGTVTIILKEDGSVKSDMSRAALVEAMQTSRWVNPGPEDDPVKRIRALRDEWDD